MKALNNIIYVLFAFMVLGSFANFAHNDYGYNMIMLSQLFIGLILLTQAVIYLTKGSESGWGRAFYLCTESFLIGALFLAGYFKYMHWPGPGIINAAGALLLVLQYFIYAMVKLVKDFKKGALLSLMVFLFLIATMIAIEALIFKIMHWPFSRIMGNAVVVLFVLILLIGVLKRKFTYNGEQISLHRRLLQLSGRPVLVFGYFSTWVIYITLIVYGIAPDFYTYAMSRPPAVEELKQKQQDDKASEYMNNYETFFQNRWDEQQH